MILLFLFLLLLLPSKSLAAVAFDAASSSALCVSCTSLSWNHTTSGSNRLLIVGAAMDQFSGGSITGVTYNSVSMSIKATNTHDDHSLVMAYLVAPTAGSPLPIAISTDASLTNLAGGGVSYTGVDQSTPLGTASQSDPADTCPDCLSTGVMTPSSTITVPTGGMAQDVGYDVQDGSSCDSYGPGSGQTERFNACDGAFVILIVGSTRSTSGTFTWGATVVSYEYHLAVPINAATTAQAHRRAILQ
jgi:hypothetical protein